MRVSRRGVTACVIGCGLTACVVLLLIERRYELPENYALIEDGLYLGAAINKPPPRTTAVLNLCEREDPYQCEVHVWDPIRDAPPAPDLTWLREKVEFIETQRKAGRTVFVHCRQGVSRSGMVVVGYMMYRHNWSRDEALKFVKTRRPITRPHPVFMERLLEWEGELKKNAAHSRGNFSIVTVSHGQKLDYDNGDSSPDREASFWAMLEGTPTFLQPRDSHESIHPV